MRFVTLSFPNLNEMAYFILYSGISDFVPDWKNAALTGDIDSNDINTACAEFNAYVIERETTVDYI